MRLSLLIFGQPADIHAIFGISTCIENCLTIKYYWLFIPRFFTIFTRCPREGAALFAALPFFTILYFHAHEEASRLPCTAEMSRDAPRARRGRWRRARHGTHDITRMIDSR